MTDVNGCCLTADQKHVQAKKEVLIEDFKFILKDFYFRMGSPEFIKEANQNEIKHAPAKISANNKSRYFAKETEEKTPSVKPPTKTHAGSVKKSKPALAKKTITVKSKKPSHTNTNKHSVMAKSERTKITTKKSEFKAKS